MAVCEVQPTLMSLPKYLPPMWLSVFMNTSRSLRTQSFRKDEISQFNQIQTKVYSLRSFNDNEWPGSRQSRLMTYPHPVHISRKLDFLAIILRM